MHFVKMLIAVTLASQVGGGSYRQTEENGNPVIESCLIKPPAEDEIRIPAQEAGMLIEMPVSEGARVSQGDLLAVIDDREAKAAVNVAEYAVQSAEQKAKEDIEERYARAAAAVAQVDLDQDLKANQVQPQAVPEIEIRRKRLDLQRATLQIEKAQKDRFLAGLEAKTKSAERDAAQIALDARTIVAPFDGEVVTVFSHKSEWVNPGDPILLLVQFDRLHVEGFAYASQFDREELIGKPVTVKVTRARGKEVTVPGKVVYVGQTVQGDGSYLVRAEVENQRAGENWLIQPGLPARMTVALNE